MATVSQPFSNTDEQNQSNTSGGANNNGNGNQAQQQQQQGGQQIAGAGGSAGTGGMTGGGSTKPGLNANGGSSNNSAATTSGNFPNLQQYMNANANFNQAGGGLAGKVVSNLNQEGQQVQNNTTQASNVFNNQVNSANQNMSNAFTNAQADLTNPYQATQTPSNISQFQQALGGNYSGPQNLSNLTGNNNYTNLQQQASNYTNQAQQTQTENGRFNLLSNMFGGNNYTQGQQTLDNSILQSSPQQMQQLKGAVTQANTVNQNLTNAYNQSQQAGNAAQANAQQIGQQTQAALNNAIGNQYGTVQNELTNATALQQQQMTAAQQGLANGSINQSLANELGLTSLAGQSMYGVNASPYLTANALNINNTATQGDYNNFQALQKLTGGATNDLTGNNAQYLNQFSANPNGTLYNANNLISDTGLTAAIQAAQGNYTNAANPYASTVNTIGNANNALYGQFGVQNGGGINFGNQTANTALGLTNPITQNLNSLLTNNAGLNQAMGGAGSLGATSGLDSVAANSQFSPIAMLATQSAPQYAGGQEAQYFGALQSLLGLQQQYNTGQQLQITPDATS